MKVVESLGTGESRALDSIGVGIVRKTSCFTGCPKYQHF